MSARTEVNLSVRHERNVELNAVLGSVATVRRLFCIVKFSGKIRGVEGVEHTAVVLEGPHDSV